MDQWEYTLELLDRAITFSSHVESQVKLVETERGWRLTVDCVVCDRRFSFTNNHLSSIADDIRKSKFVLQTCKQL